MLNSLKLFSLLIFYTTALHAMDEVIDQRKTMAPHRSLLIFLDDSEAANNFRQRQAHRVSLSSPVAISQELYGALAQQASPIIASKNLFLNVLLTRGALASDEQEWTIHDINDSLVMLIHDSFLRRVGISKNDYSIALALNKRIELAKIEQTLGLRISQFPIISKKLLLSSSTNYLKGAADIDYCDYFANSINDIFLKKDEYAGTALYPRWSIYMNGHGSPARRINGMSMDAFMKVLNFFESDLELTGLSYLTCFSGGLTQESVYGRRRFSFPIISQVIGDVVGHSPYSLDTPTTASKRFDRYADSIYAGGDFTDATRHIIPLEPEPVRSSCQSFSEISRWSNVPSIRKAGSDCFQIMVGNEILMAIGSPNFAQLSFDEADFLTKKPKGLLLYTNEIPFELKLEDASFAVIISMVPGKAAHRLKRVSSTTKSLVDILRTFMNIDPSSASHFHVDKTFKIDEIIDFEDTIVTDVLVRIDDDAWVATYRANGAVYKMHCNGEIVPVKSNYWLEFSRRTSLEFVDVQMKSQSWSKAEHFSRTEKHQQPLSMLSRILSNKAFHSQYFDELKRLIATIDPNLELDGKPLINLLLERKEHETNFDKHQDFRLELIKIMKERGLEVTSNHDIVKRAILDRSSPRLIKELLSLGAPLDVHERVANSTLPGAHRHTLLYWVLDRDGVWNNDVFRERMTRDLELVTLLVELGASCDDDDIIRHALFGEHDVSTIDYLLSHTNVLNDKYDVGIIQTALEHGYGLDTITALVCHNADKRRIRKFHGCTWWSQHVADGPRKDEGAALNEYLLSD